MSKGRKEDGAVEKVTVTWRLPVRVATDNAGNWDMFREHLQAWAESGDKLDPELTEETKHVGLRVPVDLLNTLDKEAKRLEKLTNRKWTAGRVARFIWDQWPDRT